MATNETAAFLVVLLLGSLFVRYRQSYWLALGVGVIAFNLSGAAVVFALYPLVELWDIFNFLFRSEVRQDV